MLGELFRSAEDRSMITADSCFVDDECLTNTFSTWRIRWLEQTVGVNFAGLRSCTPVCYESDNPFVDFIHVW